MQSVDLMLLPRWLVPVVPEGVVLENHALVVDGGRILALLPQEQACERYVAREIHHLPEQVLMPGLINLHTHAAMSLLRGIADDLPLMPWLQEHIWPAEARLMSPEFVHDGTLLACAEMLRGGVTTFNDMYFFPGAAAEAALQAGQRAVIGLPVLEFPTAYAADAEDYLNKGLSERDRWNSEPLLSFSLAPHAPYTVSDRSFARVLTLADHLDLPIHVHLHETLSEVEESKVQFGVRPLARLQQLGLLSPRLIAVHAVHLNESEIDLLARHGCSVAHCPTSNLKLGSGIAPVSALLAAGVNVGLGTDGAASNNRLDVWREMLLAPLLVKGISHQADRVPAADALTLATLGGARALGLEAETGSLEPGKAADLCAVALTAPETTPCFDVISHLVYVAGREHVTNVWVGGCVRVQNGVLLQPESGKLAKIARLWQTKARP